MVIRMMQAGGLLDTVSYGLWRQASGRTDQHRRARRAWFVCVAVLALVGGVLPVGLAEARGLVRRGGGVPLRWVGVPVARSVLVSAGRLGRLDAAARRSGRAVEVARLRSLASRTFVEPDGSFRRVFPGRAGGAGGLLSWGAAGSGSLARLGWGGESLALGWGGVAGSRVRVLPRPSRAGLTAGYRRLGRGVGVRVQAVGVGFDLQIMISRRLSGPVRFAFPLRLRGLRARIGAKGVVEFVDTAGVVVAGTSVGRVAGAQRDSLTRAPVRTGGVVSRLLAGRGGRLVLEVVPDPGFLRDRRVRYPVSVDSGAIGAVAGALSSRSRRSAAASSVCGCAPGAATNVLGLGFNESLSVTWSPPLSGDPPTGYMLSVYRTSDNALLATHYAGPSASMQFSFTFRDGLVNTTQYGYYATVTPYNSVGYGPGVNTFGQYAEAAPWSQYDTLGNVNPSEPAVSCRSSWGVDCGTGNFSFSHTDLSVPGRGIPLALTWTYNSEDPTSQAVPPHDPGGWTSNYAMNVVSPDANTRVVVQENDSVVYFFADGYGGWHPEGGAQATLTGNAGGGYTFYRTHALTSFVFDASGRLTSESDRNGYRTSLTYNSSGQLALVTDPEGRSLTFTYVTDSNGHSNLDHVADPSGRTVSFGYDQYFCPAPPGGQAVPCPRMTLLKDAGGGRTTFAYASDNAAHVVQITSPDANALGSGNVLVNQFDGSGLYGQSGGSGRAMSYSYSTVAPYPGRPSMEQTKITDPMGNVVVANHTNFLLTSIYRGYGSPQQTFSYFSHDPVAMLVTQTEDPRGHLWKSTYDARGNLLSAADPLHPASVYTYNAQNQLLSATDPLGIATTYTYDANNNLRSVSRPLTGTSQVQLTTYGYDPAKPGDLLSMTDPDGKVWKYTHDANGDLASDTDPLGDKTTYGYDPTGRLVSSVSPRGNVSGANPALYTTSYGYDPLGDLTSLSDPLAHTTSYTYDADQNLLSITDANLHKTSYAYDRFDELTMVTRPDLSTVKTGYDLDGNVNSQTDPAGKITGYGHDALNRLNSVTDPLNRTTGYGYDTTGNLTTVTDPAGRVTTNGYDSANELTSTAYSDGKTPAVSYGYDNDGQRTSMTDGTGPSSYVIDSLHRLTSHTNGAGRTVGYGYDLNGQPTSITYPSALGGGGGIVTRGYDDAGRLSSIGDWLAHTTTFAYSPDSRLTRETYPNGAVASIGYDNADELTSIADTSPAARQFLNLSYTRDPAGLLSSEGSKSYTYDQNDQLKTQSTAPKIAYGYDTADNPASTNINGGAANTLNYDAAHQLTTMSTVKGQNTTTATYAYDQNGNRTGDSTLPGPYSYDQANRLTGYQSTSYAYDGDGLRTKKTTTAGAEPYTWDIGPAIPEIIGDAGTAYITGPAGLPVEQITQAGAVHYYHQDQLGTTRAITDQTGAVTNTSTYDPYGNPTSQTGTLTNPFGYAGEYTDPETGLQYLRARYYDPKTQNFLTLDPLNALTRTPYSYTTNNPTNNTDPTGLTCAGTGQDGGTGSSSIGNAPGEGEGAGAGAGAGSGAGVLSPFGPCPPTPPYQNYPQKTKVENHHITPRYLGGPKKGPIIPIGGEYHQNITNEFRRLWPYGQGHPSPPVLKWIMQCVYGVYPLPGQVPLPEPEPEPIEL